jgi:hypothetical protein
MFGKIDLCHTATAQKSDDLIFVKNIPVIEHSLFFAGDRGVCDGRSRLTQVRKKVIVDLCTALGAAVVLIIEHGKGDSEFDMALMAQQERFKLPALRGLPALGADDHLREIHPLMFIMKPFPAPGTIKNMLKHF